MRSLSATPVAAGMKIDEFDRSEFWAQVDNQDSIRPCWEFGAAGADVVEQERSRP